MHLRTLAVFVACAAAMAISHAQPAASDEAKSTVQLDRTVYFSGEAMRVVLVLTNPFNRALPMDDPFQNPDVALFRREANGSILRVAERDVFPLLDAINPPHAPKTLVLLPNQTIRREYWTAENDGDESGLVLNPSPGSAGLYRWIWARGPGAHQDFEIVSPTVGAVVQAPAAFDSTKQDPDTTEPLQPGFVYAFVASYQGRFWI